MRIEIDIEEVRPDGEMRVGNVYPVRGGRGAKYGHLMILIALGTIRDTFHSAPSRALMLIVDREGNPINATSYGSHYIEGLAPVAFVEGLEDINLVMRGLP